MEEIILFFCHLWLIMLGVGWKSHPVRLLVSGSRTINSRMIYEQSWRDLMVDLAGRFRSSTSFFTETTYIARDERYLWSVKTVDS